MMKYLVPALALGLVACDTAEESFNAENDASLERGSRGFIQLLHLSPDAPPVDIVANGRRVLTDVPYLTASPSVRVREGIYDIAIPAAGTDVPVVEASVGIAAGSGLTVFAFNELAGIAPGAVPNTLDGLAPGNIRLQVIHTAVGIGLVDVWDLGSGAKLLDNFDFGFYGTLDVPEGALEIGLDLDEDEIPDATFSVPSLGADTLVNVFAINDDDGVALYAVFLDGTTARVDAD